MKTMMNGQRGISFSGFLAVAALIVAALVMGMKLVPAYMENKSVQGAFEAVVHDPDLKNAPDGGIRLAYGKRAQVAGINSVRSDDVVIERNGDSFALSANYQVKVPLVANISLLIDFNPSAK